MYEIIFYTTAQERCPLGEFLKSLEERPRTKIGRFMRQLELHGPNLPRPYADTLRGKIRELRVPYGKLNYRLLYFFQAKKIIVALGFLKKTAAVPDEEIMRAERRMQDWLERHPGEA